MNTVKPISATTLVLFGCAAAVAVAGLGCWLASPSEPLDFDVWLRAEQADVGWIQGLPPVYSKLLPGGGNPEPENCQPRLWPSIRRISNQYHPGAAYEMRSTPRPDGSGLQATYDANGNLLRDGLAAGSADRASPGSGWNPFLLLAHNNRDVIPFVRAAQLDGNAVHPTLFYRDLDAPILVVGEHLRAYSKVRPVFGPVREVQPGTCAAAVH